jgi:hypothetical protein
MWKYLEFASASFRSRTLARCLSLVRSKDARARHLPLREARSLRSPPDRDHHSRASSSLRITSLAIWNNKAWWLCFLCPHCFLQIPQSLRWTTHAKCLRKCQRRGRARKQSTHTGDERLFFLFYIFNNECSGLHTCNICKVQPITWERHGLHTRPTLQHINCTTAPGEVWTVIPHCGMSTHPYALRMQCYIRVT